MHPPCPPGALPRLLPAPAGVVAVGFHGAEGDAAEPVDFEDQLAARRGADEVDVGFFADSDARAEGVDGVGFGVVVQGEVVEAAVG